MTENSLKFGYMITRQELDSFAQDPFHSILKCLDQPFKWSIHVFVWLPSIEWSATRETNRTYSHDRRWNGKSPSPSIVILYVRHDHHSQETPCTNTKVPPLEELPFLLLIVVLLIRAPEHTGRQVLAGIVELLGAKGLQTWVVSTLCNGDQIQRSK